MKSPQGSANESSCKLIRFAVCNIHRGFRVIDNQLSILRKLIFADIPSDLNIRPSTMKIQILVCALYNFVESFRRELF